MVQQPDQALLDSRTCDNWPRLADPLSHYLRDVCVRLRSGDSQESALESDVAFRNQPFGQSRVYADPVWIAQPVSRGG